MPPISSDLEFEHLHHIHACNLGFFFKNIGAGANVNTNQKTTVGGGVKVNDTLLRVVKGSITDHDAEIIVNSTDDRLSMGGTVHG